MNYDEARQIVHSRQITVQTEENLQSMLQALLAVDTANARILAQRELLALAIHNEIGRRNTEKLHTEQLVAHQTATKQDENLHGKTMAELKVLKTSVDRLAGARWIDWAILIVGAIAAIGVIISLFLIH